MTKLQTAKDLVEPHEKIDKFHYQLLTCTLFMSQVPCDSKYDKEMAKLLGLVKKAHDEEIVFLALKQTEVVEETRLVVGRGGLIPVEKFGKKEYVSFSWVMEHLTTQPPTLNITTLREDRI